MVSYKYCIIYDLGNMYISYECGNVKVIENKKNNLYTNACYYTRTLVGKSFISRVSRWNIVYLRVVDIIRIIICHVI